MAKIIHKVPPHSQYLDVKNKRWRDKACGIVALFQVLEYFLGEERVGPLSRFIQLGVKKKAYVAKRGGWIHRGLVDIAETFGIEAQAHDMTDISDKRAFAELLKLVKKGPVIVSVHKDFDNRNGGHLIVLTGFEHRKRGLSMSYNEPASRTRKEIKRHVAESIFLSGWKKRVLSFSQPIVEFALFDTYIKTIQKSVGSPLFQHVYALKNGKKQDVTLGGELSCATYVSSVLVLFGLVASRHATVAGTVTAMRESGWKEIKRPKPGAVLVWAPWEKSMHFHMGFYIGNGRAISNNPLKKVPTTHHWTFGLTKGKPKRRIKSIWWHKKLG